MNVRAKVGIIGFEPMTPCLSSKCSKPTELNPHMLHINCHGGQVNQLPRPPNHALA